MSDFSSFRDPGRLTARQQEVIKLVAAGRTNAEIGEALGISFETAKMHVGDILDRLGVDSREEAARIWREHQRPSARLRRALGGLALTPLQRIGGMAASVATVAAVALVFVALTRGDSEPGAPPAAAASTATPVSIAPTQAPTPTVQLIGTRWDLLTIDGQPVTNFEMAAYLLLRDDGIAVGYSGCNSVGGRFSIAGTRLAIEDMTSTARACGDSNNDVEMHLAAAFDVDQSGDRLTLTGPNGTRLHFIARSEGDPEGILTLHRWQLQTLGVLGEGPYERPVIAFADDGTFSATTGCGLLRGTYARSGFEIQFAVDGDTPVDCPEPDRTIDAHLRGALANVTRYTADVSYLSLAFADVGGIGFWMVEP